jgi:hypothetical protein
MSKKLPSSWMLPETIKNRFGKGIGKQRAMIADGHLLLVLHQVPTPNQRTRQGVFFWRNPAGAWQHSGGGTGLKPLTKHLQSYSDAEEQFQADYEQAETAEDYFQILSMIAPLRRSSRNLHTTLQAAREGIPEDRDLIDLRDWAYEIERNLDLIYENTKNALDYEMARRAEVQNKIGIASVEASNRLNILAAIFYPLTAISCVFGMNLVSGFEDNSQSIFWGITLLAILLGFFVRQWVSKGKWL